jgi:hypothetical protein
MSYIGFIAFSACVSINSVTGDDKSKPLKNKKKNFDYE